MTARPVVQDPVANLPGQVQPLPLLLQHLHNTDTLLIMREPLAAEPVEHRLPRMTKRRMSQIVPQRDRLRQRLIQPQRFCDRARYLRYFQRVRQARPVMVALRRQKNLRFLFQTPERFAVQNTVAIALILWPDVAERFFPLPAPCIRTQRRLRTQGFLFPFFDRFSDIHPDPTFIQNNLRNKFESSPIIL